MEEDSAFTLMFVVVIIMLILFLGVSSQQILVSPMSDKGRLRNKILTFIIIFIDFIAAIIYEVSRNSDSTPKGSITIIRSLLAINLIVGSFLFWEFGQTSMDALYRSRTANKVCYFVILFSCH